MGFKVILSVFFIVALHVLVACEKANVDLNNKNQPNPFTISNYSNSQKFSVTLNTENNSSIPVGKFHNWTILITDQKPNPVYPALVSVTGGMPAHGHGLPTQPKVTEYLGSGKYRLEGMKFSMGGKWIIRVQIVTEDSRDVVEFSIDVTY